jgi:hypothetical protein
VEALKVRVEGGEKSSAAAFCTAFGLVTGSRLNVPVAPPTAAHAPVTAALASVTAALAPVTAPEPTRQIARHAKETEHA